MELFWDVSAGISGDMALASLADNGLNLTNLEEILTDAGMPCHVDCTRDVRRWGPGAHVHIAWDDGHPLRHPSDLFVLFSKAKISQSVRSMAEKGLRALASALSQVQGVDLSKVEFAEVGAVDTATCLLGVPWGLEQLGVSHVSASPLPWSTGGAGERELSSLFPAPAVAWLMLGKRVVPAKSDGELVTPTGAALYDALVTTVQDSFSGVVQALGTGYGARPGPGLRAVFYENSSGEGIHATGGTEEVLQLETHVDHLSGEDIGQALEALSSMPEVLDVIWLSGIGKKNRPVGVLRLLCQPADGEKVGQALFRHTHTLGFREMLLRRRVLPRREGVATLADGTALAAKFYDLDGETFVRPESDAIQQEADRRKIGSPALRFAKIVRS